MRETLAPALSAARRQVDELYSTRAEVRRALGLVDRITTLMVRRSQAQDALSTAGRVSDDRTGLPAASIQAISVAVEELLDAWHFPHEKPVYFDEARQDMVLGGRRRGDQGKGLRALTHAAFTIGLQQAIRTLGRSPVGLVVLDSPLVAFREVDDRGQAGLLRRPRRARGPRADHRPRERGSRSVAVLWPVGPALLEAALIRPLRLLPGAEG